MNVLVTGFGPFPGVEINPSGALAEAVDGQRVGGYQIVGRVLPVSYSRAIEETLDYAAQLDARLVLGTGVAKGRPGPEVERMGRRCAGEAPDVDGRCEPGLNGPQIVPSTLDVVRLAEGLDARISEDAGRYVCNAWLYQVSRALEVPVGFLHIPREGLALRRLVAGLERLLEGADGGLSERSLP